MCDLICDVTSRCVWSSNICGHCSDSV